MTYIHLAFWAAVGLSAASEPEGLPSSEGMLEPGRTTQVTIPAPSDARTRSILVALKRPGRLSPAAPIEVRLTFGPTTLHKTLHLGDPDVAWAIRQPSATPALVTIATSPEQKTPIAFAVRAAELEDDDGIAFETEPNDEPATANRLVLGRTVYGLADDRAYLPIGVAPTPAESSAGQDWFVFEFTSDTPKLAFFGIDFIDRDVPPDLRIFQLRDGKPVEYTRGIDPQSLQRERPPRPGANKFTTRVLSRGTYYLLVDACQPEYQLRTKLFDVPPYLSKDEASNPEKVADAARKAIQVAMDFQLLAGDSWHANTPRKGHPLDRIANFHHETSTCIACHPTHFTTQSVIAAVRSGYGVQQPEALRFLTDRLANNPVPFHGYSNALWARMIPAPANVLGRLSTIVMDFEDLVTGPPLRNNTHKGIAQFLKLYYDGRTELPPDESNGNNPVSRYKVATDSWRQLDMMFRRSGDPRYAETRDLIARLLPTGTPANTRDLAAQTIGLALIIGDKQFPPLVKNIRRLLELQRPNGHWSVKFDPNYAITEMQTGESLYALALAGLGPDHPAVQRGVVALLLNQKDFGAWFDANPYEQFRTPFRETQWSLIALSKLYPGPGTKGWNDPLGLAPKVIGAGTPAEIIADLERMWDNPSSELVEWTTGQLHHEVPMVRYAACRTLSRIARATWAIPALAEHLGDESKVVQRAAAEAIRSISNRADADGPPAFLPGLAQALASPDDRTRRGATRIFAAHFRDLSQDLTLADDLLKRLNDDDPVVQMQAIKGLWRWWYWRAEPSLRDKIEDRLIAKLAEPTHPWVRRNLVEALYIIGDENIRYLYNNWVPSLATKERRDRATAAQHATSNRLGAKYVAALDSGNALQREGVLRAISEFFERPVQGGRIGNDLEPMLFYEDALPRVSAALMRQMTDPDPTIRRLALQALVALRGYRDPALARAVVARQGDADESVRDWAGTMGKEFPLPVAPGKADAGLLALLDDLLASPVPEAQASALELLGRLGPLPGEADRSAAIEARFISDLRVVRAAALRALPTFPKLLASLSARTAVADALDDDDVATRIAAVRLALDPKNEIAGTKLRKALEDPEPAHRIALLDVIAASKANADDLRLVGVVSDSLDDDNGGVREKALQVIQLHPTLVSNPAVAEGLSELAGSANTRQKEIAATLLTTRGKSSAGGNAAERLDLAYFEAKVLPIFNTLGEDGQNCVGCHRSHTILKMVAPAKDGTWSPNSVRANFRAALRVVNLPRPADSLLLGKPTWEAAEEAEAQNDPTKKAHAGGVRFEKGSPEYQAILDWINGARLRPGDGVRTPR
jgi:HEAT repeat protein